ncbi:phospholipase, partial [Candidatus Roizmanbacteria bacterium]|nr:phospholipase [Candidatus Roizmanbacteria bacterium]
MVLMEISENHISIHKTARYYTAGDFSKNTKNIWFVLHGYSQLAGDFIRQFDYLLNPSSAIVAPESLSRFYINNNVGASWMTKEDRVNEINDYIHYLDKILSEILINTSSSISVNLLGFSQGAHTAARWFILGEHYFKMLILCSSDFPKDADFSSFRKKLANSKFYYM